MSKPRKGSLKRAMSAPVPTEHAEHVTFVRWLRAIEKQAGLWWCTVGHGGYRLSRNQANLMQARGVRPGVPDVLICHRGRLIGIELKRVKGGSLSEEQKAAHEAITLAGGCVFVAKGAEAAIRFVTDNVLTTQQLGHGL